MKEIIQATLTIPTVEGVKDLIKHYQKPDENFAIAFVKELDCYAVAIEYQSAKTRFVGYSSIEKGGFLKTTILEEGLHRIEHYIYQINQSQAELYSFSGGPFELFGSKFSFDLENGTVEIEYLKGAQRTEIYRKAQQQSQIS
ncbi:hypothetical protein SFC65_19820 [Priestia filamentosa]|uniref:hypothetical protein n=1 Tax=Priestia filamentosa TaxID=1402861 RepID=UPI0039828EF4